MDIFEDPVMTMAIFIILREVRKVKCFNTIA
jgi:hypothetical protein